MQAHMLHKRRTPGRQRHRIDQRQAAVVLAIEQMRAQRGGAAEVMGDHVGTLDIPVIKQLREESVLDAEGHIRIRLLGTPVAEQVEIMHPVRREKMRRNAVPYVGREGRAMHKHQRRAVAAHGMTYLSAMEIKDLIEQPVRHGPVLLADFSQKA